MWRLKKGLYYCGEDHLANGKEEAGKAKVTSWRNGRKARYLKGMAFVGMSLLRTTTSNMETEAEPQAVARAVLLEEPGQSQNCGEQNNAIYGNIM